MENSTTCQFTAQRFLEDDGSITLSLNEIDLIENGENEDIARLKLANAILEYSREYNDNYADYSQSANRKNHAPFIVQALDIDNPEKLRHMIICQNTENWKLWYKKDVDEL